MSHSPFMGESRTSQRNLDQKGLGLLAGEKMISYYTLGGL